MLIGRKPKLPAECEELLDDIEQIPDLQEGQVKEIIEELGQTNIHILLKMKQDIFDDAHHNIKTFCKQNEVRNWWHGGRRN